MARGGAFFTHLLAMIRAPLAALFLAQCSPADNSTSVADADMASHDRLNILLMTSLPIVWGDGASMQSIISGETAAAPIYAHWQRRYEIAAVDSFENLAGPSIDLVILAQPPAMDPADIAALDQWIREGGHALIFTDPILSWPTSLPLGDRRRPLPTGLLSPLLGHWGLELVAPELDESGLVELEFANARFMTSGLGKFLQPANAGKKGAANGTANCSLGAQRVIAHCQVGKGRAILVADADLLNHELWDEDKEAGAAGAAIWVDRLISDLRENRG